MIDACKRRESLLSRLLIGGEKLVGLIQFGHRHPVWRSERLIPSIISFAARCSALRSIAGRFTVAWWKNLMRRNSTDLESGMKEEAMHRRWRRRRRLRLRLREGGWGNVGGPSGTGQVESWGRNQRPFMLLLLFCFLLLLLLPPHPLLCLIFFSSNFEFAALTGRQGNNKQPCCVTPQTTTNRPN